MTMVRLAHPARKTSKRHHIVPASAVNSDINVTPLVDVVLVLLIIFMVVTPLLERQVSVQVPSSAAMPTREPLHEQVVVSLGADSSMRVGEQVVETDDDYIGKLRARLQGQPERVVFFRADDQASYQRLIAAMDGAKRAGAEKLAFVAERR